jgi:hypothetical protein
MTNADWRFSINWPFREEASSDFYAWTAPEAARCGNRIALYEGGRGNRSSFVAIGRMVTDSVRAHQGDKRHWGWVQWVLLEKPCSMGVVKKRVGYANLSGRHVSVEPKVFERLWELLLEDNPEAASSADRWDQGKGFPTTDQLPISHLFDAKWRYRPRHEVAMYEQIRELLFGEGCEEAPDEVSTILGTLRGPTPTEDRETRLIPDLWVLDGSTLLLVEVKRRARHRPDHDYDPVDQVRNYVKAATDALQGSGYKRLRIEPMLVAEEFDSSERKHAAEHSIPCRRLVKGELRTV